MENSYLPENFERVLLSEEQIAEIVSTLAERINHDFQGRELLVVGILKGSFMFMSDLVKALKITCHIDFMSVSSYGNATQSSGRVNIVKDLSESVSGKDVLVIEDIIDSGITLDFIIRHILNKGAESVSLCTLLNKPHRRKKDVPVKYWGREIEDEFVVGYGMDYAEKFRNLPFIGILKEN